MADCFAIFAGGGAKGFAHVGALKSAEHRNLKFVGVAGASAGSIIATLVAAGFRADDLYRINPSGAAPLLSTIDWIELLGSASWQNFTQIRRSFDKISSVQGKFGKRWAWQLWRFYRTWSETLKVAIKNKGLFTTEGFEIWLDEVLRERLGKAKGGVTFADLEADPGSVPLKLVAVDIEAQKLVTFSHATTPDMVIAKAVSASISIPFFFAPTIVNGRAMVDGGLLSNFPAWLFDFERSLAPPYTRTYGFTLIERGTGDHAQSLYEAAFRYVLQVINTGIFGGQTLLNESVEMFQIVPIVTNRRTFDLELTENEKNELYTSGLNAAEDYFTSQGVVDDDAVTAALKELAEEFQKRLEMSLPGLRANVILPVKKTHLRVSYSYNMQTDADDRLLLPVQQNGAGEAMRLRQPVLTDLGSLRQGNIIGGLSKYESVLVRTDRVSLISIPIFGLDKDWGKHPKIRSEPRAILCFDCDQSILPFCNSSAVNDFFAQSSIVLGRLLRGQQLTGGLR